MSKALAKAQAPELKRVQNFDRVAEKNPELRDVLAELEHNSARAVDDIVTAKSDVLRPTSTVKSEYTAQFGECVLYDPSGGAFTIHLPKPSRKDAGQMVWLKNTTGSSTTVTLRSGSGVNIDGGPSVGLATGALATRAYTDGTNWWLL